MQAVPAPRGAAGSGLGVQMGDEQRGYFGETEGGPDGEETWCVWLHGVLFLQDTQVAVLSVLGAGAGTECQWRRDSAGRGKGWSHWDEIGYAKGERA